MLLGIIGWVEVEEGMGRVETGDDLLKVLLLDDHLLEPFRGCFHLLQISQWHVFIDRRVLVWDKIKGERR